MTTVEEYMAMAEKAKKEGAHVGALTYYRTAIEAAGYKSSAADVLLAAVRYAQILKKEGDRLAIAAWSTETLGRIQVPNLAEIIDQEIVKLLAGGKTDASA